jgi:hypothetical protein
MPLLHRLSPIFRPKRRKNEMHVCAPINRLGVLRSPTQALPPTWISLFLTRISNLLSDTLSVCPGFVPVSSLVVVLDAGEAGLMTRRRRIGG